MSLPVATLPLAGANLHAIPQTAAHERVVDHHQTLGQRRTHVVLVLGGRDAGAALSVGPHHLVRRVDHVASRSYAELFEWLAPGQLLDEPPETWATDWSRADPDSFDPRPAMIGRA
jgi:hypothetical protein